MRRNTIFARFASPDNAERAIGALIDHGVDADDISVVFDHEYRDLEQYESLSRAAKVRSEGASGITTTTAADAASGAGTGAGVGLGIGLLAAAATVFVPGVGVVLGGGVLATTLAGVAGATAAGAIAGGLTGYLKDQGVSSETIERIHETLGDRGALVAVSAPSGDVPAATIESLLNKYAGLDVGSYAPTPVEVETSRPMFH